MGLDLRLNLFRDAEAPDVFTALSTFYGKQGMKLVPGTKPSLQYELLNRVGHWCVLKWDAGWEWKKRREAQLWVSKQLHLKGLLIFAYDGDYWGYELFSAGVVLDRFVQSPQESDRYFPNESCRGNPALLASELGLSPTDSAAYIAQCPTELLGEEKDKRNTPVRPGDLYNRYDECAVLDFLNFLDVPAYRRSPEDRKTLCWRSFSVADPTSR